jgi:hypothetical protein
MACRFAIAQAAGLLLKKAVANE